jgi:hypothetical protein
MVEFAKVVLGPEYDREFPLGDPEPEEGEALIAWGWKCLRDMNAEEVELSIDFCAALKSLYPL